MKGLTILEFWTFFSIRLNPGCLPVVQMERLDCTRNPYKIDRNIVSFQIILVVQYNLRKPCIVIFKLIIMRYALKRLIIVFPVAHYEHCQNRR